VESPHFCAYQPVLYSIRCPVNICSGSRQDLQRGELYYIAGYSNKCAAQQAGCATVAILLHYFFLTTFMWMLMEGVVLYIVLVKVFARVDWKYYTIFTLLCYGKTIDIH